MDKTRDGLMGGIAGMATAAVLQPLENIKMALMFAPKDLKINNNFLMNLIRSAIYIKYHEGVRGFFKGNVSSMMRAGVGSFFYFSTLRALQKMKTQQSTKYSNFIMSSLARIVSSIVSNPINVIQTRFEMTNFHGYTSIADGVVKIYTTEGVNTFFKGGLTSCYKEGMFAGMYYMLYMEFKQFGYSGLISGLASGLISTATSHPLEIIRAKLQVEGIQQVHTNKVSILSEIKKMTVEGGWFKGLTPRLIKKPMSNAFAFVLFENMQKKVLAV